MPQLGINHPEETLRYLIKTRQIRHCHIAGRVAFHREHLDEYAKRNDPRSAARTTPPRASNAGGARRRVS